jgi:PRC-barrel domain protein
MEKTDETVSLISAGKVQGTNVYNTGGDSLGEVYDVMIDKRSGKVAYAIMSFGGLLGVGERYHPLPWNTLKYDTRQGGYVVGLTREQLEGAPHLCPNRDARVRRSRLREEHPRLLRRTTLLGLGPRSPIVLFKRCVGRTGRERLGPVACMGVRSSDGDATGHGAPRDMA